MTRRHGRSPTSAPEPAPATATVFGVTGYWLVVVLLVISYALCAAQSDPNPTAIAFLAQLATVAVTLWVTRVPLAVRRIGWAVLAVAAAAALIVWITGTRGHVLDLVLSAASAIAWLAAPIAIIRHQLQRTRVDRQSLLAAISAYVMVGMFFTFVYNFIALVTVTPTFGDDNVDALSTQLFFSFTTLTTVGYGNVVPATAGVQSVAVAEAITGQLFLLTAVARIISGPIRNRARS